MIRTPLTGDGYFFRPGLRDGFPGAGFLVPGCLDFVAGLDVAVFVFLMVGSGVCFTGFLALGSIWSSL